jgi:uncharacterized protein YjiS (DUF1127 family)
MKQMKQNPRAREVAPSALLHRLHGKACGPEAAGTAGWHRIRWQPPLPPAGGLKRSGLEPRERCDSMVTHGTRYRSTAVLFLLARGLQATARRLVAAARRLQTGLDRRRVAAAAFNDFGTMSERDLLDIGLTQADLNRVAWGASDHYKRAV